MVIESGESERLLRDQDEGNVAPVLMINSYNLKQNEPIADEGEHWERIAREAYGGFIIEMGDAEEHGSFDVFQSHMEANLFESDWDADERILYLTYRSGDDTMEMGFGTDHQGEWPYPVTPGEQTSAIPYRRTNGEDPYLPAGIDRDTTLTQQGTTGRLEKNGAVLEMDQGRKAFLQTEPITGTYTGYNPFPELSPWALRVPGDVEVRADGRLGLARVSVRPSESRLWVDSAWKEGQCDEADAAERLLVFGRDEAPTLVLNGAPFEGELEQIEQDDRQAYVVPLTEAAD